MRDLEVLETPRVRQRETFPSRTISHYEHHTWHDAPETERLVEEGVLPASSTIMHDVVTSPFWEVIRRGGIVNKPMHRLEITHSATPCSFVDVYNTRPYAAWNDTVLHTGHCWPLQRRDVFPTVEQPPAVQRAREKAIARVFEKAAAPVFNSLINLYQLPKLVQMLRTAFRRLGSLHRLLTSRDPEQRIRALGHHGMVAIKNLDGLWLEWRYGWRPLIMDLVNLADAFAKSTKKPPPRITYRATEKYDFEQAKENTSTYDPIGSGNGLKNSFQTRVKTSYKFRAGIMLDGASLTVNKLYGFRKEDVPAAVWDAVPYSFVVDWFVGVTTWLIGTTLNRENILASWVTATCQQRTELVAVLSGGTITSGTGSSAKAYSRSLGVSTYQVLVDSKTRDVGLVAPSYPILDPKWSELTNFLHLLDALSLLVQQFRGLSSRLKVSRR